MNKNLIVQRRGNKIKENKRLKYKNKAKLKNIQLIYKSKNGL